MQDYQNKSCGQCGEKFNETDEMKTTNTVTLPAVSDNPTSYYFDYEKAELYLVMLDYVYHFLYSTVSF